MIDIKKCENEVRELFLKQESIEDFNSRKVLEAFKNENVNESCFYGTTGYGHNDYGREVIERVYARIFKAEDALVRTQFISGTHALTVTLFGLLRPNDILLSITGKPYDTLEEVIGIRECDSSLKSYGIEYRQVDLINNEFDYEEIKNAITKEKIKVIEIQRSKGYSTRKSINLEKIEKVIKFIKEIDKDIIIMIDNCYCEFVNTKEPIEVGADVCVGSLIKNLGGGISPNGGYVVGKKELVRLISDRLNVPGCGKDIGPSLGQNKNILHGLFLAPSVVCSSIKIAILTGYVMDKLGYDVEPRYDEERVDIVNSIYFRDRNKLIKFCNAIQASSAIDANVLLQEEEMPGYDDKIIMASGSFTQGSSIELSCDGPIREPYIAYMQGGLTYSYGKIALENAVKELENDI